MIGPLLTFVLITAVLTLIISATIRANADANGNYSITGKARAGVFVALAAAILASAGETWMDWLLDLMAQL